LKDEESNSSEEEPCTPVLRRSIWEIMKLERYTPSDFCLSFVLSINYDDPRTVREVVDSEDGKLWKKAMVEMESLDKN
jgi:hypothetical protein